MRANIVSKIDELIARVRELDAAATPGPWDALREEGDRERYPYWGVKAPGQWIFDSTNMFQSNSTNDSLAIAHYRTAAPKLADMLDLALDSLKQAEIDARMGLAPVVGMYQHVIDEIEAMAEGGETQ